jgi:hypothetical protein
MKLEMVGRLIECFLISYAVDRARAAALLPTGLAPITCRDAAFVNIVACRIDHMRPRFAPYAAGVTYWHVAYRIQARAVVAGGGSIEGLYFLRSDVDRPLLGAVGNLLTDFRFHRARVRFCSQRERWTLHVDSADGAASAVLCARAAGQDGLPPDSPFGSVEERERVLTYTAVGLSVPRSGRGLRVAEVLRDEAAWQEQPVVVEAASWDYLSRLRVGPMRLVRATRAAPIEYTWRLGRVERVR